MTAKPPVIPMKRAAVVVGVVGLAVLVSGFVIEGGASLALFANDMLKAQAPRYSRSHTAHDTLLGWVNRPSFSSPNEYGAGIGITTNELGLRGPRSKLANDTSANRLVCSGDSVTLGYGVSDENSWCALLAQYFPTVETLNMGQAAYGLDQAYLWYKRDSEKVKPQIQIFAMIAVQFERAVTTSHRGRFKPMLALQDNRLVATNVPVPVQTTEALNKAYALRSLDNLGLMRAIRRIPALDGTLQESSLVDERWPVFEALFDDLCALNAERGVETVLAYLPFRNDMVAGPLDKRRARIADIAARQKVRFVDLTPQLRAMRPDSVDLLFISRIPAGSAPGIGGHYTNLGNAWVARLLAERLADMPVLHGRLSRSIAAQPISRAASSVAP